MNSMIRCVLLLGLFAQVAAAATVSSGSLSWTPLAGNHDDPSDQQAGSPSGDIVGIGTNYGFLVTFNDNGPSSHTDGTLGFRIRLDAAGGATNKPSFDRTAWVGIDADLSGSVDVFLGLNLSGNASELGIYAPGPGAQTSPSSTSISNKPTTSYVLDSSNYNYRAVNVAIDGGTTNDATPNTTGDPDYYVSFMVAYADVVSFLSSRSINITDQSMVRYIVATSTQPNSINQDIGGVNGGINSTIPWTALDGFTPTVNAPGVVPEPGTSLLLLISGATFLWKRRKA